METQLQVEPTCFYACFWQKCESASRNCQQWEGTSRHILQILSNISYMSASSHLHHRLIPFAGGRCVMHNDAECCWLMRLFAKHNMAPRHNLMANVIMHSEGIWGLMIAWVTVGHLGVTVGHFRATAGHLRVIKGPLRVRNWSLGNTQLSFTPK